DAGRPVVEAEHCVVPGERGLQESLPPRGRAEAAEAAGRRAEGAVHEEQDPSGSVAWELDVGRLDRTPARRVGGADRHETRADVALEVRHHLADDRVSRELENVRAQAGEDEVRDDAAGPLADGPGSVRRRVDIDAE